MKDVIKRRRWTILIGLAALAGVTAVASAAIPDGSGVIHGCYKKDGRLRVIDTATDSARTTRRR